MSVAPAIKKQSDSAMGNPLWKTNESIRRPHDDTTLSAESDDQVSAGQNAVLTK